MFFHLVLFLSSLYMLRVSVFNCLFILFLLCSSSEPVPWRQRDSCIVGPVQQHRHDQRHAHPHHPQEAVSRQSDQRAPLRHHRHRFLRHGPDDAHHHADQATATRGHGRRLLRRVPAAQPGGQADLPDGHHHCPQDRPLPCGAWVGAGRSCCRGEHTRGHHQPASSCPEAGLFSQVRSSPPRAKPWRGGILHPQHLSSGDIPHAWEHPRCRDIGTVCMCVVMKGWR